MKKILLINCALLIFNAAFSQTFWTEDFGSGCSSGTAASGFVSSNGTWTVTSTGINDSQADVWYVSAKANNTGVGICATGCSNANNRTLHVGNADLTSFGINPDSSCTYLTGLLCSSFSICSTTHKRAESPVINCTGRFSNTISFNYLENGEGSDDDATLWCFDGITWTQVDALAKTTVCGSYGIWTSFTVSLPASADNNANVKIAFQWTNDNDAQGSDPSFAVDDIAVAGLLTFVGENISQNGISIYAHGNQIHINTKEKISSVAVVDLLGRHVSFSQSGNTIDMSANPTGIYFVKVYAGEKVFVQKMMVQQ